MIGKRSNMKHFIILILAIISLQSFGQSVSSLGSLSGNSINKISGGISSLKGLQPPMSFNTWANPKWNLGNIWFDSAGTMRLYYFDGYRQRQLADTGYVDSLIGINSVFADTFTVTGDGSETYTHTIPSGYHWASLSIISGAIRPADMQYSIQNISILGTTLTFQAGSNNGMGSGLSGLNETLLLLLTLYKNP